MGFGVPRLYLPPHPKGDLEETEKPITAPKPTPQVLAAKTGRGGGPPAGIPD